MDEMDDLGKVLLAFGLLMASFLIGSQGARVHSKELSSSLVTLYSPSGFLESLLGYVPALHFGEPLCLFFSSTLAVSF